ncbi:glycoside hydrolase family 13 protein [Thalassobacillus sp. CUG 92003]|uniref:glycoside hydrolase family 13 protein n=1 Tax=Thalassobacillus sp. CUG 92003 TaxID=2736641 RepID=UPI0015E7C61F|nr:glycoside hydrolase family 13 protein [Thalassobacillus sp. CUG 92003]
MKEQDIYHNSFELSYREPFGAAPKGSNVSLSIDVNSHFQVSHVILHYIHDRTDEAATKEMDLYSEQHQLYSYETTVTMPTEPQLIWYFFEIVLADKTLYYGRENIEESGEGRMYDHVPPSWQITVYDPGYETPKWWKHATMYHIFPDRFHRLNAPQLDQAPKSSLMHSHWENDPIYIRNENGDVVRWDFFGGTLQGIIHKLDYIRSLGVDVIYLNPIFEAESNHRYDTGDYHQIDPLLGSKADFEELISEAVKRNIEIMLDGVFNHTGSNSIYFNERGEYDSVGAYQSTQSPYYPWYTFYNHPDEYESWWGVGTLPTVKKENESFQKFLIHDDDSVIKTWQRSGLNHWRLDVADELTDDLIKQIYRQLKSVDESSVLLGEVWEDASNKIGHGKRREYLFGGVLDSIMNYPFRKLLLGFMTGEVDAYFVQRRLLTLSEHYPKHYFYAVMNMLSTHDVARVKTLLTQALPTDFTEEDQMAAVSDQVKSLSLWLYAFPGVPSLYYGDEAGVTGGSDPDNRKPFPWGREEQELVAWYQQIGQWRKDHVALRTGSWLPHALHKDVFGFERWTLNGVDTFGDPAKDEHMLFLTNRHLHDSRNITLNVRKGKWQDVNNKKRIFKAKKGALTLTLAPRETLLLRHMH